VDKQYLLDSIEEWNGIGIIEFDEILNGGIRNHRRMLCGKKKTIEFIERYFDDDLYGHFGDNVMTTIIKYYIKEDNT